MHKLLLSNVETGKRVTINTIHGSVEAQLKLAEIGCLNNTKITMLNNDHKSPLLIKCRSSNIILSRELSSGIEVIPQEA